MTEALPLGILPSTFSISKLGNPHGFMKPTVSTAAADRTPISNYGRYWLTDWMSRFSALQKAKWIMDAFGYSNIIHCYLPRLLELLTVAALFFAQHSNRRSNGPR